MDDYVYNYEILELQEIKLNLGYIKLIWYMDFIFLDENTEF